MTQFYDQRLIAKKEKRRTLVRTNGMNPPAYSLIAHQRHVTLTYKIFRPI